MSQDGAHGAEFRGTRMSLSSADFMLAEFACIEHGPALICPDFQDGFPVERMVPAPGEGADEEEPIHRGTDGRRTARGRQVHRKREHSAVRLAASSGFERDQGHEFVCPRLDKIPGVTGFP